MLMKLTAITLKLAIIFQLVLGNIPITSYKARASSCSAGLEYNAFLGRCLTSPEAAVVKDASLNCMKNTTREAQVACLNSAIASRVKNAEENELIDEHSKVGFSKGRWYNNPATQSFIALAGIASGWLFLANEKGKCPGATSAWLIAGAGVAALTGEIWSAFQYRLLIKDQEELLKKMSESSAGTNTDNATATDIQSEIFSAMIVKEDATIKSAKTKKTLYIVATTAYAAATVLAIVEAVRMKAGDTSSTCTTAVADNSNESAVEKYVHNYFEKKQRVPYSFYVSQDSLMQANDMSSFIAINQELDLLRNGNNNSISLDEYSLIVNNSENLEFEDNDEIFEGLKSIAITIKNNLLVPDANASGMGSMYASDMNITNILGSQSGNTVKLTQVAPNSEVTKSAGKLKKFFLNPYTRIAFAALLTTNASFMISNANKQITVAEERKSFIEGLRLQVLMADESFGACTDAQRSDPQKPTCYCFTSSGVNPARSQSAICKQYFASNPKMATTPSPGPSDEKLCVAKNGLVNKICECRKTKSCVKGAIKKIASNIPGAGMISQAGGWVNGLLGGLLSSRDVNTQQGGTNAARLNAMAKKMLTDPKSKPILAEVKKAQNQMDKLNAQLGRQFGGGGGGAGGGGNGPGMSSLLGSTPQEAIEKLKEELKKEVEYENSSEAIAEKKSSVNDDFSFDDMDNTGIRIEDDAQVAEVMNSNFNYGENDINGNSGEDIFKILSNRYQRSGMRRLFGGEALVPADEAAESEISN
jgi:hypothetical protein